jgi:hypothetical protein
MKSNEQLSDVQFNVTGLTDCSTAMHCAMFGVSYVSLLYGRMEEVGINPSDHLMYYNTAAMQEPSAEVIAGSMRTMVQLADTFRLGALPTIGTRVFDLIFSDRVAFDAFFIMTQPIDMILERSPYPSQSPMVGPTNYQLSTEFFAQMDELGSPIFQDFLGRKS